MGRYFVSTVTPLTAGCKKDFEKLLKAFKETGTLAFDAFSKCFRDMDLVTIFMGRLSEAELVEFSEKLLQLAISYAMSFRERMPEDYSDEATTSSAAFNDSAELTLQERIFGVYLAYSLYYVQPSEYVSQIRITPEQAHDLAAFVNGILLPDKHYDAVLAYFRLVSFGAFRIVAFEKDYNPLLNKRFDKGTLNEGMLPHFEELSLLKSFANDPLLAQADIIHKRYEAAKQDCNVADLAIVNVIKKNISELYEDVMENAQQRERRASAVGGKSLGYQSKSLRSTLKEKAYKMKTVHPRQRRHRAPSGRSVSISANEADTQAGHSSIPENPGG